MSSAPVLQVRTPFVALDLFGPYVSPRGSVTGTGASTAHLTVSSTTDPTKVKWADPHGILHDWSEGQQGPRFFEDTVYRLRAKSLLEPHVPVLVHRDPYLMQNIDAYSEDRMCAGPINFRRQVGRSTLEIRVGHETLHVTLEVFPVKLDYLQDYHSLLADVSSAARGLALEYLRATFRSGSATDAGDATGLEWVTLLRNEIDVLAKSLRYVNEHPYRTLALRSDAVRLERTKRVDASVRRALLRRIGTGPLLDIPNVGPAHQTIPAQRNRETLDTPEHRWLRLNLSLIGERLATLHASVVREIDRYLISRRRVPERTRVEELELARYGGVVNELRSLPVFEGVTSAPPPGFASLSLLSGIGYGDAYRAITVIRMGLDIKGDEVDFSVRDVHDLYEIWCFVQLVKQVAALAAGEAHTSDLLRVQESGIRVRLRRGKPSEISFVGGKNARRIVVSYNPTFPGLTGDQRPDVVVRLQQQGWPDLVVVFDAKYRLDASEDYRRRFGTAGPPQDAVNAIHRYRDAIVVESRERGLERPVVKGAALFPLSVEESRNFRSSPLFGALSVLGVGALPFLPSNTSYVDEWLKALFSMAPEDLAHPGPPFSGLAELNRRA